MHVDAAQELPPYFVLLLLLAPCVAKVAASVGFLDCVTSTVSKFSTKKSKFCKSTLCFNCFCGLFHTKQNIVATLMHRTFSIRYQSDAELSEETKGETLKIFQTFLFSSLSWEQLREERLRLADGQTYSSILSAWHSNSTCHHGLLSDGGLVTRCLFHPSCAGAAGGVGGKFGTRELKLEILSARSKE